MSEFIQEGPILQNQFEDDHLLLSYLQYQLPSSIYDNVKEDFYKLGERVISDIFLMGKDAMANEPELIHYDVWGNRIDKINVAQGWKDLKDTSASEGLVAIGYNRDYAEYSRLVQFTKLYLFTPSSAIYTCPLAMTDGAARLLEIYGDKFLKGDVLNRYISRDPSKFWVSGQWMTEKTGGSDLARTETIARREKGIWRLYGPKWFTSAITAQTAMTLARIEENDEVVTGSKGLSLFYLQIRDENDKLNQIQINRLKDKLGTRALPTAELELNGTPAHLIGEVGKGIKQIATMLNITRIYNSISAVSLMRRALAYAKDYAKRREAFERFLVDLPLHAETLVSCEIEFTGSFLLVFYVVELLGKTETDCATDDESKILRLLTPIVKLYTGKKSISVISELLECMGGAGYLEDSQFPTILRDAQVLSIWEGTTNVLSLDTLRSIFKEDTFPSFLSIITEKLSVLSSDLTVEKAMLESQISRLVEYGKHISSRDTRLIESEARLFSFGIAETMIGTLLLDYCNQILDDKEKSRMVLITQRWLKTHEFNLIEFDLDHLTNNKLILE